MSNVTREIPENVTRSPCLTKLEDDKVDGGRAAAEGRRSVTKRLRGPNYAGRGDRFLWVRRRPEQNVSYRRFFYARNSFGVNDLSAPSHHGACVLKPSVRTRVTAQVCGRTNMASIRLRSTPKVNERKKPNVGFFTKTNDMRPRRKAPDLLSRGVKIQVALSFMSPMSA